MLEQQATKIDCGRYHLWIVGVGDLWEGAHDITAALAEITDVALTMVGHTHGGQVWLPLFGRLVVPSAYGQRFAIGHIVEDGRHLFVTPGVGTSVLPIRFLVPPEVSMLRLTAPRA